MDGVEANIVIRMVELDGWNASTICRVACLDKWHHDLALSQLWRGYCFHRAPEMATHFSVIYDESVSREKECVEWLELAKIVSFFPGASRGRRICARSSGRSVFTPGNEFLFQVFAEDSVFMSQFYTSVNRVLIRGIIANFNNSRIKMKLESAGDKHGADAVSENIRAESASTAISDSWMGFQPNNDNLCAYCDSKSWDAVHLMDSVDLYHNFACERFHICQKGHFYCTVDLFDLDYIEDGFELQDFDGLGEREAFEIRWDNIVEGYDDDVFESEYEVDEVSLFSQLHLNDVELGEEEIESIDWGLENGEDNIEVDASEDEVGVEVNEIESETSEDVVGLRSWEEEDGVHAIEDEFGINAWGDEDVIVPWMDDVGAVVDEIGIETWEDEAEDGAWEGEVGVEASVDGFESGAYEDEVDSWGNRFENDACQDEYDSWMNRFENDAYEDDFDAWWDRFENYAYEDEIDAWGDGSESGAYEDDVVSWGDDWD